MDDNDRAKIELRQNGPLVVKGLTSMVGEDGAELEAKPVMALCRCGQSQTKPFCDGSHKEAGFLSENLTPAAGRDRLIAYQGAEVTITYNPLLCSHAAECGRLARHIFNPDQKPWIQPDNGTRDEVLSAVAACPSGALALIGPEHLVPERAEIKVEKNGPYWVTGPSVDAPSPGEGACTDKLVLCRCGHSGNKPYCDGSHRDKGWKSQS